MYIWKHFLILWCFFSSSGLIGFVKRISGWNLQLVLYIISLWMQNYSCPDKKRRIGRWSMRTMAKFHSSQRWSTRGSMTSQSHGMMTPKLITGRSTSLTCLRTKPECLKSAPSPLFPRYRGRIQISNWFIIVLFFFFGYLADFRFLVFQLPCAEKYSQEVWPTVKSSVKEYGISCELNLVSFCKWFFFFN